MFKTRLPRILAACFASLLLGTAISGVTTYAAESADKSVRVRGEIIKLSENQLLVKTREGTEVKIALKSGWQLSSVARAELSDINPGDYVGIASLPKSDGGNGALEVLIFPPQLKGLSEGSFQWDLKPNSTMTNATVADAVKSINGNSLTLSYHGKEKKISIPDGTPIVTLAPAIIDDVKPGVAVFVPATKAKDGAISADRLIVGKNGVVPPM